MIDIVECYVSKYGRKFFVCSVKVFAQVLVSGFYIPDAEDMRQNKVIFTLQRQHGQPWRWLERFYTADVKNIDLCRVETAYGCHFYLNLNNNGDVNTLLLMVFG